MVFNEHLICSEMQCCIGTTAWLSFDTHQLVIASYRTPGAMSINTVKVQSNGSLAGGLITGVSGMSATSYDSTQPIKAGIDNFGSDQSPRVSQSPRSSSYVVPESPKVERSTDSQNRASLLGVQPLSVEASGGSLLSSGANKQVGLSTSFWSCISKQHVRYIQGKCSV